jgi:hypothetical protein
VGSPPLWKLFWPSGAALVMELLHLHPFGRGLSGAGSRATAEGQPNMARM